MIVYRYVSESELKLWLSGEINCLGNANCGTNFYSCNTHKYKQGVRYLHFYRNNKILKELQREYCDSKENYYICEFDIPLIVLLTGVGFGYYNCSGYTPGYAKYLEFAINADRIKLNWFKRYDLDSNKNRNNVKHTKPLNAIEK